MSELFMTNRQRKTFSPEVRPGQGGAGRRRGTIMILVMTVLGILFVTGVAFMATMSFESELIRVAQERESTQPVMEDVSATIDEFVAAGVGEIINAAGDVVTEQPNAAMESLSLLPFAQTPGRFNSFSPIEPYVVDPTPGNNQLVWGWFTDVEALAGTATDYLDPRIDTALRSGTSISIPNPNPGPPTTLTLADADGDGIVDAHQVNLEKLGFTRRQIDPLAKVLNAVTNPTGSVFFALRTVPHGGMVNLTDGHQTLIRELFSMRPDEQLPQELGNFKPYSPAAEEPSLRRRGMLPPRELPPTRILGSLLDPNPDTGGADYPTLYWPNETVAEHRHWPFTPDEYAVNRPDKPIWSTRMDPRSANPNDPRRDEYDRRHLVTSISHDDQFRRATVVDGSGQMDVVDWALANDISSANFPYLDYPSGNGNYPNTYTGTTFGFDRFDRNACLADPDNCKLNPRKGRLRLSMAWLDEMWDWNNTLPQALHDQQREIATETIQDVFTLLLLNARGSVWGDVVADPANSPKGIWRYDYAAISKAAAELTANLIDFADFDLDIPTAVTLRDADFTNPLSFGTPTGTVVYGLENQPYITEVAASATEDSANSGTADKTNSTYGIELFNPYDTAINLADYSLLVESTTSGTTLIALDRIRAIAKNTFLGFVWGDGGAPGISGDRSLIGDLDFAPGSTIKLIRTVGSVDIVVDEFDLSSSVVGTFDGKLHSRQRYAQRILGTSPNHWYATVPDAEDGTAANIGKQTTMNAPGWQPVQAIIANAGSFSEAFPTTGSLLLLMRFANTQDAAFTSQLGENNVHPIDDGHMPIYDVDGLFHHMNPAINPEDPPGAGTGTQGQSGTIDHLPWGQLVFDYFTSLPLENSGPYGDHPNNRLGNLRKQQPRVDMDGMRVHGRIDINAAPWFVMKGLPFIPMESVPFLFRDTFRAALKLKPVDDLDPQPIGPVRAQAIAAYRDKRLIRSSDPGTGYMQLSGDYDSDPDFGRGWQVTAPKIRRGMGFLTIGELANVRHPSAALDPVTPLRMRFDNGVVGSNDLLHTDTYLEAVATLACLSDWVSVRSQVFTVYGTLRGNVDPTIVADDPEEQEEMRRKDVDTRAIRFQETIDRLPTFLGAEKPAQIGNRVLATYNDVRND